jgi:hypothetical protein
MVVGPVFVTVDAPSTAKLAAEPRIVPACPVEALTIAIRPKIAALQRISFRVISSLPQLQRYGVKTQVSVIKGTLASGKGLIIRLNCFHPRPSGVDADGPGQRMGRALDKPVE